MRFADQKRSFSLGLYNDVIKLIYLRFDTGESEDYVRSWV